ncbi:homeobox protein engrailed-2b-like isoform X2 [Mercenaria mercenaria]|uniref:homeobox protein engrailed-2b-like isoform X2 n=1 Tax=Mercenaria mercenaria TaxID=6596 RepID=UPI00234F22F8|nr:homeobox protein engrailed-2b-like isoform X2 [Mercenaria mercenaria]
MYFQSGNVWHTLHFIDARRLLELQQYQVWMEKQQHLSLYDPFEPIRRLAMAEHGSRNPEKPLTSFRINDILADASDSDSSEVTGKNHFNEQQKRETVSSPEIDNINLKDKSYGDRRKQRDISLKRESFGAQKYEQHEQNIIRPWNLSPKSSTSSETEKEQNQSSVRNANRNYLLKLCNKSRRCDFDSEEEEEIDVEGCEDEDSDVSINISDKDMSPLDALMAMSSKTFMGLDSFDRKNREDDQHGKSQIPKKKRKTRTAFTNQQIYELEKRFILQKYLTPSDRDEIAAKLGLSCAQVITWFQNRRAKFKRDIEEMKHDVVSTSPKRTESDNEVK